MKFLVLTLLALLNVQAENAPKQDNIPEEAACQEALQFQDVDGNTIRIAPAGPAPFSLENDRILAAKFQSPNGGFDVLFSTGALRTLARINRHRSETFAQARHAKVEDLQVNCLSTLRFSQPLGTLDGLFKPFKEKKAWAHYQIKLNPDSKTSRVVLSALDSENPSLIVEKQRADGSTAERLIVYPFDYEPLKPPAQEKP
jgi:hypothetical protein